MIRLLHGDYNIFRPNVVTITDDFIEFRKRDWHMLTTDKLKIHFGGIRSIKVDKGIMGAKLLIGEGSEKLVEITGLSKKNANLLYDLVTDRMAQAGKSNRM